MDTKDLAKQQGSYLLLCSNAVGSPDYNYILKIVGRKKAVMFRDGFWQESGRGLFQKRESLDDAENRTSSFKRIQMLKRKAEEGAAIVFFPEAHVSIDGTQAVIPESAGKLAFLLKIPVFALYAYGEYSEKPFWRLKRAGTKKEYRLQLLADERMIRSCTRRDCIRLLKQEFRYDEYSWRRQKLFTGDGKAGIDGLERILYKCPSCKKEDVMSSRGRYLYCLSCHGSWTIGVNGEISADAGGSGIAGSDGLQASALKKEAIAVIPDWAAFEKRQLLREILSGDYSISGDVAAACRREGELSYTDVGRGTLRHSLAGLEITVKCRSGSICIRKKPDQMETLRFGILDGEQRIYLEVWQGADRWRLYSEGSFNPVKLVFAVEVLSDMMKEQG